MSSTIVRMMLSLGNDTREPLLAVSHAPAWAYAVWPDHRPVTPAPADTPTRRRRSRRVMPGVMRERRDRGASRLFVPLRRGGFPGAGAAKDPLDRVVPFV